MSHECTCQETEFQKHLEHSELLQEIQNRIDTLAPLVNRLRPIESDYRFRSLELIDPLMTAEQRESLRSQVILRIIDPSIPEANTSTVTLTKLDRGLLSMHILNLLDPIHLALLSEANREWYDLIATSNDLWTQHARRLRPLSWEQELARRQHRFLSPRALFAALASEVPLLPTAIARRVRFDHNHPGPILTHPGKPPLSPSRPLPRILSRILPRKLSHKIPRCSLTSSRTSCLTRLTSSSASALASFHTFLTSSHTPPHSHSIHPLSICSPR
jgi:hypothetical protein